MAKRLDIVGNGRIGGALGSALAADGWKVNYFDIRGTVSQAKRRAELAKLSDIIIIAAPSWVNREIVEELKSHVKGKLIVTVAKGVEPGFITMEGMLKELSQGQFDYGVLYGPMLADEIADKKPASILLATTSKKWAGSFAKTDQIKIIYSDDPLSVALCGVLKNVFAISLGISDGLELGHNAKGALAVSIVDEFQRLLVALGGDPRQAYSLAGLGDLIATGWSNLSFNHEMGKLIARDPGGQDPKSEGTIALKEIKSKVNLKDYPVLRATYDIVFESADPLSINNR